MEETRYDVRCYCIKTGGTHRTENRLPALRKGTEVVKRSGHILERFAIHHEGVVVIVDRERARWLSLL